MYPSQNEYAEYALTLDEWRVREDEQPVEALTEDEIFVKDSEATQVAIARLIYNHFAEFETILQEERVTAGVDNYVTSHFKKYLDKVRKSEF